MACLVRVIAPGGVVEWLMALVLKTSEVKASAGSNPAPSVYCCSCCHRLSPFGLGQFLLWQGPLDLLRHRAALIPIENNAVSVRS